MSFAKYGSTIETFVKKYREQFDLTQEDLAKKMEVSFQYVSNVECGRYKYPTDFCSILLTVVDKPRVKYLEDLIDNAMHESLAQRMAGKGKRK